ncbi:MAG: helix-turn-helix domain-containing protein, partial [Tepidiformaceae bacterium]
MERPGRTRLDQLTPRQREVLALIARGRTNGEIAQQLGITLDGVKWHVREILSKLDVPSREEAAEVWRGRGRLSLPGWVAWPGWRIAATTGGVAAALLAVVVVVLALRGGEPPESEAVGVAPTTSVSVPAILPGHVPFKECRRIENWRLPTIPEMAERVYSNPRFGESGGPYPPLHALYLSPAVYNYFVTANSAQIEPSSFSGIWFRGTGTTEQDSCREFSFGRAATQALWLKELEVISLERDGEGIVATVKPSPGLFQVAEFDASAAGIVDDKGVETARRFDSLRLVDQQGNELFRDESGVTVAHEADGRFRVASVHGVGRVEAPLSTTTPVEIQVFA